MTTERREHKRTFFTLSPERLLYLYIAGQYIKVGSIWDVSPFGVGLQIDNTFNLDHLIRRGTEVTLAYQAEGVDLMVYGAIMWSMVFVDNVDVTGAQRSYRMGISLMSDDIEANVTFFKYVTGQLDTMPTPKRMSRS